MQSRFSQKIKCQIQYNITTAPIIIPANFRMATLFPDEAMRVRRVAEPLSDVPKEEKVSLYRMRCQSCSCIRVGGTYRAINDMLVARIIVDVYRYAPQRRHFGGEFIEAGIVLLFALVGLRHCCGLFGAPGLRSCREGCVPGYVRSRRRRVTTA